MNNEKKFNQAILDDDVDTVNSLLNEDTTLFEFEDAINAASSWGFTEIVRVLLNYKNNLIDPTTSYNYAIFYAYKHNHMDIVELLSKDKRVQKTFKKDQPELYKTILKFRIQEKIGNF